jgi:hypothetical protein
MRDITDAHYLHERHGLELILEPPVEEPCALCWLPGRRGLLAAEVSGRLMLVHPILGTRVVAEGLDVVTCLAVHPSGRKYAALNAKGLWIEGMVRGAVLRQAEHGLTGECTLTYFRNKLLITGENNARRTLLLLDEGRTHIQARIPRGSLPFGHNERIYLARSTKKGLHVIPFAAEARFPKSPLTKHRLSFTGESILGLTEDGACLWNIEDKTPRSVRLSELTTGALSCNGEFLALGTQVGVVGLAAMNRPYRRIRPYLVRSFDQAVTTLAFSEKDQWLAAGADTLQILAWEE